MSEKGFKPKLKERIFQATGIVPIHALSKIYIVVHTMWQTLIGFWDMHKEEFFYPLLLKFSIRK